MNNTLSERLEYWRIKRPSGWLMNEFMMSAKKLEEENAKLKGILHAHASCSPHVLNPGQPNEVTCALCRVFIDGARDAFGYAHWPATPHTKERTKETLK